jgi:hypothetical protein
LIFSLFVLIFAVLGSVEHGQCAERLCGNTVAARHLSPV